MCNLNVGKSDPQVFFAVLLIMSFVFCALFCFYIIKAMLTLLQCWAVACGRKMYVFVMSISAEIVGRMDLQSSGDLVEESSTKSSWLSTSVT